MKNQLGKNVMAQGAGKTPSQRQLRFGEEIRHALAWIIERGEIRDPRLIGLPVTVTEVRVSPDLRNATVFVVPLGGGNDSKKLIDALGTATPFLRYRVAQSVTLKYVPNLIFKADASFDQANRIHDLLKEPIVARDISRERDDNIDDDEF